MPTIKICFDNNVTNDLILPANEPRMAPIRQCVERGALEFYGTHELVGESLRIIERPARAGMLQGFGTLIGALTDGRHFNLPEEIMDSELRGAVDLLAPAEERQGLRALFDAIATTKLNMDHVKARADEMKQYMDNTSKGWTDMQTDFRQRYLNASQVERSRVRNTPYADYQRANWEAKWREFIRKRCVQLGIPDPDKVADMVMVDPAAFPWVVRYQKIFALILYWHLGQDRTAKDGDQNDAKQLFILPAVNFFVTGDAVFKKWATILGDPVDKILTVDEFLGRTWC